MTIGEPGRDGRPAKLPKPAQVAVMAGLSLFLWGGALSVALLVSGQAIA